LSNSATKPKRAHAANRFALTDETSLDQVCARPEKLEKTEAGGLRCSASPSVAGI
jgi:hypothetical protein